METNNLDELITVREFHELSKLSNAYIYKLIERKKLQAVRFGRVIRIRPSAIEQFLKKNETEVN